MANALGYVSETETGFEGALAMMSLNAPIRIMRTHTLHGAGCLQPRAPGGFECGWA